MKNKLRLAGLFWISLILILQMTLFSAVLNQTFSEYNKELNIDDKPSGTIKEYGFPETRGTRSIESADWPMFHRDVGHTGCADPSLAAPDTNDTAWIFPTAYDIDASCAIVGDMVYFANKYGNVDEDCMIYGVNETTGIYWNFTDGDYGGQNSFRSAPAIADITSYGHMLFMGSIGMGATPDFAYGLDATPDDNNDGIIDALDNDEGINDPLDSNYDLIWRSKLADYTSTSSPIVAFIPGLATHVMYVVGGQTLHALNAQNGNYIWNFTTGGYIGTSPALGYDVLGNPVVFIGSDDGFLYALNARGAGGATTIEWQYNIGGWIDSSPTIADDRIFIGSWSNDVLICLDATPDDNGDTLITEFEDEGINDPPGAQYDLIWEYNVGYSITSTAAVHNQRVFITAYDGNIYAFEENASEPSTSIIWSYYTGGGLGSSSPVVADGKVLVGSSGTKKVIAVDEIGSGSSTTLIWDYQTNDAIYASPAVANGKVYIGSTDGTFYVFGTGGSINRKPYPPELYSPLNTAILTTPAPRFDWSEAVDVDGYVVSYEIEIDNDSDFSSPEYFEVDISLTHYFPAFIVDGTYYWHVRAMDDMDAYSIWSEAWLVTVDTINDAPQVRVLSPNGGEAWAGAHDIWWQAYDPEAESMSFHIWLSDDSGASYDILLAANLASHIREWRLETTDYPDGTTYRIKVNATDERDLMSQDTSDSDFTIDNANGIIYDDWPQFHHHENNTGYSPSQAPDTNNTDWIFDIGREIDSSPSVFANLVFVGDHNGSFWALDEDTGEPVWRYDHTDVWSWCDTSPAIGYSSSLSTYVVFFGLTITDGYNFFAMDVEGLSDGDQGILEATLPANVNMNGDVLWAYKAKGSGALSSSPTVFDDTVYIGFFETDIGDDNASLFAFDINGNFNGDDGIADDILNPDFRSEDILWRFDTHSMAVTTTPAVENIPAWGDVVFIGTDEGYWTSAIDNNFFALDADPFDDLVDQGAVDPPGSEYDLLWEVNLEDYIFASPAVAYDNVYITTYSSELYNPGNGGMLYCIDAATGNTDWSYEIAPEDDFYASPAVWNDMVYVPSRTNDQRVYAFDATPEDGIDEGYDDPIVAAYDIIWIHDIYASKISSSPAVANGRVYVGCGWEYSWGEMYCLDAMGDGSGGTNEIWVYGTNDFIYGSPSVANAHVYVADTDGYVYRFGALIGTDLTIKHEDVTFSPETPQENNTSVTISAKVTNLGNIDAMDVLIRIFDDLNDNGIMDSGELITDTVIMFVTAYSEVTISVDWNAEPVGYHNLYFIVDPLDSIDEIKEDNNQAWSFFAVEAIYSAEIDYIIIRTLPNGGGFWVGDKNYNLGAQDTFYCAGYNDSLGYIKDVSATWQSNDTNIATVTSPGTSTTFTASGTNSGYVIVTATYNALTNITGILTVKPIGIDYIIIRDAPSGGGSWMGDKSYGQGVTDTYYCAAYNNTLGYIQDISAGWESNDTNIATVTTPGPSTTFTTSITNVGYVYVTATYNTMINTTGILTVTWPGLDYIIIRDAPNGAGSWVNDKIYGIGGSDTFYCAGYNNTAGFVGDVTADWLSNDTNIATVTTPGLETTFTASTSNWGVFKITATYTFLTNVTGTITILPPSPDSIMIRSQPGNGGSWIGNRVYGVDDSDTFYCAAYNITYGYIEDLNADWASSVPSIATVTSPGIFTIFSAGNTSFGDVYVTASYSSLSNQTGTLTIIPPTVDHIIIRDESGGSGNEVAERTFGVGDSDTFYCAGYNDTIGYIDDLDADWTLTNPNAGDVTTPGTSTTFTASTTSWGDTYITATFNSLSDQTGKLNVLEPTYDYLIIRDEPGGGGNEVGERTFAVGDSDTFYCAGYNDTIGYISDLDADWSLTNTNVGDVTSPGTSTTFTASTTSWGYTYVKATYDGLSDQTGKLTVLEPTVDYIKIRNAPNGGGSEIGARTYVVGQKDTFYCAGYNETSDYVDDVLAEWSSSAPSIGKVTLTGYYTTFSADNKNSGTLTVTAEYDQKEDTTGVLTVLAPKVDYAIIVDEDGDEVERLELDISDSITIYCAGYNHTAGFIGNLNVIWDSDNSSVASVTSPGSESTLTAGDDEPGQTLITATYQGNPIAYANVIVVDDIAPIANAGEDQTVKLGDTVYFDGSGSSDNLEIVTYTWSFEEDGEPITLSGKSTQYEFTKAGTYTITLTVTDSGGNTDSDTLTVIVEKTDEPEEEGMWWLWILIVIIVIVVVLLLLFLMTKKKKKEETVLPPAQPPAPVPLPPPPSAQPSVITQEQRAPVTVTCPSCKNNFSVQAPGAGLMTVTCPHCGASGQMQF